MPAEMLSGGIEMRLKFAVATLVGILASANCLAFAQGCALCYTSASARWAKLGSARRTMESSCF